MVTFMVILSGMEIVVWAALLFTGGFAMHFWWMRHALLPEDSSLKEKALQQELERWKKRFLKETEMLSRELDRLRTQSESATEHSQTLQTALIAKEELLERFKQEHKTYRDLLTASLQSGESIETHLGKLTVRTIPTDVHPDGLHLDGESGRTLHADLHRAEVRIEELELKLMDREDEIERLKATGGAGDVNEELLEKISQLESQLIHARSIAESLEQSQTRVRELEEYLADTERRLQVLTGSHYRLTEEHNEQYSHFKEQMSELVAARQRLAHLQSQAEEPPES